MNVDSILISEYATSSGLGLLTVVCAFNKLMGPGPTWGLNVMAVSLVVHGHRDEAGTEHRGELRLLNARRENVLPEKLEFSFSFRPDDGTLNDGVPIRHVSVLMLYGIRFTQPGPYAFEVQIDGIYHASASLYIQQVARP